MAVSDSAATLQEATLERAGEQGPANTSAGSGCGRVRVFARVRPQQAQRNCAGPPLAVLVAESAACVRVMIPRPASLLGDTRSPGLGDCSRLSDGTWAPEGADEELLEARDFLFDGVFPMHASQGEVYNEVALPILQGCLQGLNGTILAYGQTGSGKTHSLLRECVEDQGLLFRLANELFAEIAKDPENVYKVTAAAMQIYNEQIDDLLVKSESGAQGHQALVAQAGGMVPGLTWVPCNSSRDLCRTFARARAHVVYAETKMNKASSRSHAVFQVRIVRRACQSDGLSTTAHLNVVDLAGSERVKKSGVEGLQFKEATAINRSLLALGNVVSALASKKPHVGFRDSKLTRVLEGSIGGNSRTALLVCASTSVEHAQETVSTFEFASRAMRIEVNARVNMLDADFNEDVGDAAATAATASAVAASTAATIQRAADQVEEAEARAAHAEEDASEWQRRALAAEAALEALSASTDQRLTSATARMAFERARAGEALSRMRQRSDTAEQRVQCLTSQLASMEEELQEARAQHDEAMAKMRAQLEDASQRSEEFTCKARQAEQEASEAFKELRSARVAAEDMQADAAAAKKLAEEREATASAERSLLAKKRQELELEQAAAISVLKAEYDARLREVRETLGAQVAEARARGEAELSRRLALCEEISSHQDRLEEQQRELEACRSTVEGCRKQLRHRPPALASGLDSRPSSARNIPHSAAGTPAALLQVPGLDKRHPEEEEAPWRSSGSVPRRCGIPAIERLSSPVLAERGRRRPARSASAAQIGSLAFRSRTPTRAPSPAPARGSSAGPPNRLLQMPPVVPAQ